MNLNLVAEGIICLVGAILIYDLAGEPYYLPFAIYAIMGISFGFILPKSFLNSKLKRGET